jgi:sodium-dependent dicarboxylate transporter 2/3/5
MGGKLQIILSLHPVLLILVLTGIVIFLTETVSNTAITAAILPVLFGVGAQAAGGPLPLLVPATLAASCAFMLPIGTPPNAVVFGTGRVPMLTMMRYGAWLNLIGTILIPGSMYLLGWVLLA